MNNINNYNKMKMGLNQKYYQEESDAINNMEIFPFPNQMDINSYNKINSKIILINLQLLIMINQIIYIIWKYLLFQNK